MVGDLVLLSTRIPFSKMALSLWCRGRVAALLVLPLVLIACVPYGQNGMKTKEEVVSAYLDALLQHDESAIANLVPTTHYAEGEIGQKIEQMRGNELFDKQIAYASEFGQNMAIVTITGKYLDPTGNDVFYEDTIHVKKIDKYWYLILGRFKNGVPPAQTLEP